MIVADSRALDIINHQAQLESNRSTWDAHYREIAERVLPRQDDFQRVRATEGEKRTQKIFDATAPLALDRAASAIDSLLTPTTQMWHNLEGEGDLANDLEVKRYCQEVTKILFKLRYRPFANFAAQAHESYVSLMAFGTMGVFSEDVLGQGIRYKSIPMSELYIAEDSSGRVDLVHRKFEYTVRQAIQKWGKGAIPESLAKLETKEPFRKFTFIHCVKPNPDMKQGAKGYRGWPRASYYVETESRKLISTGGFRTMPYLISRHVTAPKETYGRSPAMIVLADIKMVNEMEKTTIRAAHKIVDPPLLLYGDGILSAFNTRPNALNFGGVDDQGRQLVHPMKTGSNLPIVFEMAEQKRKVINDAFFVTLFQILVQNPQMTATEAMIRAQEKGQLLAPTVGRQESEFLGPLIERDLDIASAAGLLPEMPEKLRQAGGIVKVVFTSPLKRLQRAADAVAISRTIEGLTPIAQYDPTVMDIFDSDAVARELADINGAPAIVIRSPEEIAAIRENRKQVQMMQQGVEGAEAASNAAKNMAQAAQMAGFVAPAVA